MTCEPQSTGPSRADWRAAIADLQHEGRFDAESYFQRYKDVAASGLGPFEHYVKYGRLLGREFLRLPTAARQNGSLPKVSVLCTTYNHEKYIRDTLEGFCSQRTTFDVEFLIGDDQSTDDTSEIIRRYAREDSRIVPIIRERNIGAGNNFAELVTRAQGEYVAICEGDDYWTDSAKLQKQADFLDENPECSIVFHPVVVVHEGNDIENFLSPEEFHYAQDAHAIVRGNFIQTTSVMYRWRFLGGMPSNYNAQVVPADWFLHMLHAEFGKTGFVPDAMAVYRKHASGMWAQCSRDLASHRKKYGNREIDFFREGGTLFGGHYAKQFRETMCQIFIEMAERCLATRDVDALRGLVKANPDIADECMRTLGFRLRPADLPSADALWAAVRKQHKTSVIVTAYNQEKYIRQCLESVFAQDCYFDLEVIIGDDGSSDGTAEIVSEYQQKYPHIIKNVSDGINRGMQTNLQRCLAQCSGAFIAFCEGDDYWLSERKLYKQVRQLASSEDLSMSFSWVLLLSEVDRSFTPHPQQAGIAGERITFDDLGEVPYTANFSCCVYRAAAVEAVPATYFQMSGAADWLFNLYVAQRGDIGFVRETLSVYRLLSSGQWTGLPYQEKQDKIRKSKLAFREIFGPREVFGGSKIIPRIVEIGKLDPNTKATIDSVTLSYESPQSHRLRVSGWLFDLTAKPARIVVAAGGELTYVETHSTRNDVISAMRAKGILSYRTDECGFSFDLNVPNDYHVDIGIETEGTTAWWLRVLPNAHQPVPAGT